MPLEDAIKSIKAGLTAQQQKLHRLLLERLEKDFKQQTELFNPHDHLFFLIKGELAHIESLDIGNRQFNTNFSRAVTGAEKKRHLLNYATHLGSNLKQVRQDRKALKRWLWHDTLQERYYRRRAKTEQRIVFWLTALGSIKSSLDLWKAVENQQLLLQLLSPTLDYRVAEAALKATAENLARIPSINVETLFNADFQKKVYHLSLDDNQVVWLRYQALSLLKIINHVTFVEVVKVVLRNRRGASSSTNKHAGITAVQEAPGDVSSLNKKSESNHAVPVPARGDDHFFLRRRILRLMAPEIAKSRDLEDILFQASKDPSPYVRRELARILPEASEDAFSYWSQHLVTRDPSPRVRASVLLALQTPLEQNRLRGKIREILEIVFAGETDSFVLRVAIKVSLHCIAFLSAQTPQAARDWSFWMLPVLNRLHTEAVDPVIRRRAASAREHLWCMGDSEALQLKKRLEEKATGTGPGKRLFLPADFFKNTSEKTVGRVLSLMAQQDYGFELRKETFWYELIRGPLFRHRWWRFLYEIRRPSPAKRQGFSHTRSRSFEGHLRAPSDILAELTPTEVPGEPVYTPSEQGWRPYLPLPEDYLSSLFLHIRTKPVKIFTSEGITTIRPPQSPFKRVSAFFKLSARFRDYAGIRIRETSTRDEPEAFTKELAALGFQTHYQPYAEESGVDPSVSRYFPALGAVPVSELLEKFKDYFVFIYENTFTELILFAGSSLLIFVGRNLYLNARHRRLRKRIPLVIGGWGTRGKSSVERLKAGLINAMGYSLVSKTTGSEATFLHADTFRPLREIPLFRPYDKPTIWEQQYVTRIAGGVDAEVLLWECMGLQPDYVETLQQSWMRDDFSTITNTYPDHEDIMGPAGIDVPEVMTRFIPPRAGLVTTEEQMLPVLKNGASGQKTKLTAAGWLEAGLITDDILARFPYNEHPYNIALVLGLAGELGIPEDFALKEMADRVVAEIGMLKTYPRAPIRRRTLEFTNGMAANERMGFLSNWERTGFACQNYESEPGVFISTVVNNRADRIPRSQVFAQIIVDDISADRFFLIGSNLNGLMGYIQTAWHKKMAQLSLWDHDKEEYGSNDSAVALLNQMTRAMRIPMNETILQARLKIMLGGLSPSGREKGAIENLLLLWNRPAELAEGLAQLAVDKSISEELAAVYEKEFSAFTAYNQLKESIQKALPAHREDLNSKFKDTLSKWFHRKIIVIKDYHASGDTVVHTICNETPPGFLNRIMGIQNIKGTGMEFVNRWFAFEACFRACEKLAADDPVSRKKGMDTLVGLRDFGLLSEFTVEKALEAVGDSGDMHDELFHSNLLISETNFKNNMKEVKDNLLKQGEKKGFLAGMVDWLERFIDPLAGVKRKKKVKRIYRDLTGERISQQQATTQLKILKKAQEGGWLYKRLELMFKKASGGPATRGWADPPGAPTRGAPRGGTP